MRSSATAPVSSALLRQQPRRRGDGGTWSYLDLTRSGARRSGRTRRGRPARPRLPVVNCTTVLSVSRPAHREPEADLLDRGLAGTASSPIRTARSTGRFRTRSCSGSTISGCASRADSFLAAASTRCDLLGDRRHEPRRSARRSSSSPAIWKSLPKVVFSRTLEQVEGNARSRPRASHGRSPS